MVVATRIVSHPYRPGVAMAPEAIPFQFLDFDDLIVTREAIGLARPAPLHRDVDFALSGDGMAVSGRITALAGWPTDTVFVVTRRSKQLQKVPLPPHEPLPSRAAERELDRLTMVDQEQRAQLDAQAILIATLRSERTVLDFGATRPGEPVLDFAVTVVTAPPLDFGGL